MGSFLRSVAVLGLMAGLGVPANAQGERCTHDALTIDGVTVNARFCVPAGAGPPSVGVTETFTVSGKSVQKTLALAVVSGARTSRTIDEIDLGPLGVEHSLHMTLAYRAGSVTLEHALALPGAIPLK